MSEQPNISYENIVEEFRSVKDAFTRDFTALCNKYNMHVGRSFDDKDYYAHKIILDFNYDEVVKNIP